MSDKYEAARILGMTKNIAYDGYSFVSEAEQMALRVCELEAENAELRKKNKTISEQLKELGFKRHGIDPCTEDYAAIVDSTKEGE